jgi:hypothetical protein
MCAARVFLRTLLNVLTYSLPSSADMRAKQGKSQQDAWLTSSRSLSEDTSSCGSALGRAHTSVLEHGDVSYPSSVGQAATPSSRLSRSESESSSAGVSPSHKSYMDYSSSAATTTSPSSTPRMHVADYRRMSHDTSRRQEAKSADAKPRLTNIAAEYPLRIILAEGPRAHTRPRPLAAGEIERSRLFVSFCELTLVLVSFLLLYVLLYDVVR